MDATRRRSRCWESESIGARRRRYRYAAWSLFIGHLFFRWFDIFFFFFFFLSAPWSQVAYHRAAIYSRHFTSKRQLVEINDNLLTSRLLARYAREKWNKNTITVSRERLTFHCFNLTIWWQCNVAISEKRNRLRRIRLKFDIKSVNHQKSTKIATIKEQVTLISISKISLWYSKRMTLKWTLCQKQSPEGHEIGSKLNCICSVIGARELNPMSWLLKIRPTLEPLTGGIDQLEFGPKQPPSNFGDLWSVITETPSPHNRWRWRFSKRCRWADICASRLRTADE